MLQTADAALQETQDVLDRMVELTTQAANDINTDSDRRAIQDELDQLIVSLNGMLDRIDTAFKSEKSFVSNAPMN